MRFPLDLESKGKDSELKLLVTKTVVDAVRGQLHLNVAWLHLFDAPRPGEEDNGYVAMLGYSQRLTTSTVLIVDFLREEGIRSEGIHNRAELGVRFQVTPLTVLSLGVSGGVEQDSDKVRAIGAVQHSLW